MPSGSPFEGTFEDEFGAELRRTGDAFAPTDLSALVDGALIRGRRRMVLRRTVTVTVSVLALAAVGLGGAVGSGQLGGPVRDGVAVAASGGPVPAPDSPLVPILEKLLAAGELSDVRAGEGGRERGWSVSGVFDDGQGAAAISVSLTRVGAGQGLNAVKCPDQVIVDFDDCTSTELADGSRLLIFQGYEYPDRREPTKLWRGVLLTADGFLVDLSEYNAPAEKGAKVSRIDPPLDPARLKALVTSDEWRGPLGLLPTPPPGEIIPTAGPGSPADDNGKDAAADRKTLVSLLPDGLTVTDQGGEDGYAYVVVDDGRGRSFVQVNVQPRMTDVKDELFGEAERLPDGMWLNTKKDQGEKGVEGVVMWTADTLRPDGLRVVISAFNAGDQHSPATRETPALTMRQLTEIATSGKWLPGP
ncbi:hypothetical protein [Streptomyces sp. NPDC051569]|uniref:hypothetical protein n=1 Tax=Streptomyces sp. NPDC051569 TaxID=3365661 RepID=UPI00379D55E6